MPGLSWLSVGLDVRDGPSRDIEIAFNKPLLNSLAILLLDYILGWVSCEWVSVSRVKNHPKYAKTTRINTK